MCQYDRREEDCSVCKMHKGVGVQMSSASSGYVNTKVTLIVIHLTNSKGCKSQDGEPRSLGRSLSIIVLDWVSVLFEVHFCFLDAGEDLVK